MHICLCQHPDIAYCNVFNLKRVTVCSGTVVVKLDRKRSSTQAIPSTAQLQVHCHVPYNIFVNILLMQHKQ